MTLMSTDYLRFVLALALVLGLIALFAWLAKRFKIGSLTGTMNGQGRLQVVESLAIDGRQRLIIVRQDDQEHLLLIGPETGQLVEANIARGKTEIADQGVALPGIPGVAPISGFGS